jgi:hypothetical protein
MTRTLIKESTLLKNDVLIYLLNKRSWTKEQLANMKNNNANGNGYKLFLME